MVPPTAKAPTRAFICAVLLCGILFPLGALEFVVPVSDEASFPQWSLPWPIQAKSNSLIMCFYRITFLSILALISIYNHMLMKMSHPLECKLYELDSRILNRAIRILIKQQWLPTGIKSGVEKDFLYSLSISTCLNNPIEITLVFLHDLALKTHPGTLAHLKLTDLLIRFI